MASTSDVIKPPPLGGGDAPSPPISASDVISAVNSNAVKTPAWSIPPSNGGAGGDQLSGSSWPALSECSKSSRTDGPSVSSSQISIGNMPSMAGPVSREPRPASGFAPQPHYPNDQSNHRGSNRRGNFGQRGHGRNNYRGSRHDQDHRNYHDWNSSRSVYERDAHGHPRMPPGMTFLRPYVQNVPCPMQQAFRPYGNTMVYTPPVLSASQLYYPFAGDSYRGMSYYPNPPYYTSRAVVESQPLPVHVSIVNQIDYYFSDANLVGDEYLKSKMDSDGWVPIDLIAEFRKVKSFNTDTPSILQYLSMHSNVVEVQGEKVRKKDGWEKWITENVAATENQMANGTC